MNYVVTYEGESEKVEDDKSVVFTDLHSETDVPDDFMPKMFEYLESDYPYDVLYQIKSITKDNQELESKNFVSIIAEYKDQSKGGLLLEDKDGLLELIGIWNTTTVETLLQDIYGKPNLFELVVVTIAESVAPK